MLPLESLSETFCLQTIQGYFALGGILKKMRIIFRDLINGYSLEGSDTKVQSRSGIVFPNFCFRFFLFLFFFLVFCFVFFFFGFFSVFFFLLHPLFCGLFGHLFWA